MPRPKRTIPWLDLRGEVYYVFWNDPADKPGSPPRRLSLGTKDAGEAQARYAAFLIEGPETFGQPKPAEAAKRNGLTVAAALDDYWREHIAVEAAAPWRVEYAIKHLKMFFGDRLVTEIDIPLCREYAKARKRGEVASCYRHTDRIIPAGDATIRRELGALAAAIQHEVKWKRLSPADVPHIEKPSTQTGLAPWLFRDELAKLRDTAEGYVRDFIDVAYYTASRRGAVEALTIFQVDLDGGMINLSPAGDRVTAKRRGIVPIDDDLVPTMHRLVAEAKRRGDARLFPYATLYRPFVKACRRAGVMVEVGKKWVLPARGMRPADSASPHILRHSRATHLLQDGVDPWNVASLLHDTVDTVLKTYGHHCPEHLRRALRSKKAEAK